MSRDRCGGHDSHGVDHSGDHGGLSGNHGDHVDNRGDLGCSRGDHGYNRDDVVTHDGDGDDHHLSTLNTQRHQLQHHFHHFVALTFSFCSFSSL